MLGPTKTGSSRRKVRLGPETVAVLREHLKRNFGSDYVFMSVGGHPKCTTHGRLKMYQGSVAA
jgi:hypothetical protein